MPLLDRRFKKNPRVPMHDGQEHTFRSELPADLQDVVERLRRRGTR